MHYSCFVTVHCVYSQQKVLSETKNFRVIELSRMAIISISTELEMCLHSLLLKLDTVTYVYVTYMCR